jgi:hypothetical protein
MEKIQSKLNEHPTWREVIDLIAETRAKNDVLEMFIADAQTENHEASTEKRKLIFDDILRKIGYSVLSRKQEIIDELTATLCKDIT